MLSRWGFLEVLGFGSGAETGCVLLKLIPPEAMKKKAVSRVAKGKMAKSVVFRGSKDRRRRVGQQKRTGIKVEALLVHRYVSDASHSSPGLHAHLSFPTLP